MMDGSLWCWDWTSAPLGPTLKTDYPEIAAVARMIDREFLYANEEAHFKLRVGLTDPDFLTMFDFPLLQGDRETALNEPYSVILTEQAAIRLFGEDNPLGLHLLTDIFFIRRNPNGLPLLVTAL